MDRLSNVRRHYFKFSIIQIHLFLMCTWIIKMDCLKHFRRMFGILSKPLWILFPFLYSYQGFQYADFISKSAICFCRKPFSTSYFLPLFPQCLSSCCRFFRSLFCFWPDVCEGDFPFSPSGVCNSGSLPNRHIFYTR